MDLVCVACIAFGNPEGGAAAPAETVYLGNALCMPHLETGFSNYELRRHQRDKGA